MAMSAGPTDGGDDDIPMSDINTTPLVDVMLVLLIIFLIAVPVVVQTVPLTLPKVVNEVTTTKPENVLLAVREVNGECETYWGVNRVQTRQQLLDRGVAALRREIDRQTALTGQVTELPEVHIRGDQNAAYRCIGGVIYTMQRAGFIKVGFLSEPPAGYVVSRQ
jgi:biopolymer transport protein ExbD